LKVLLTVSGTISSVLHDFTEVSCRIPSKNVAEDIRRKFSREWWALCREEVSKYFLFASSNNHAKKKSPNFSALMEGSGEVLVKARDMKNRR